MAIIKNTAGQGLYIYAHDVAADTAKTGDAAQITATISKDGAAGAATNTANPTEIGGGVYWYPLTQAESNAGALALVPVSATADVQIDPVIVLTQDATISSRASQASVDALPSAAAVNTFNDTTYDGDGVLVTQGTISSGTPADTLTIGTPLVIASTGAGIDIDFEFELGTARVSELVAVGYYTGAGGVATSKYASVYLWDYSLAVPDWVLITDGSNRIPHGATNVTRQYVIAPQYQDPATGQVKVRYLSSRTTNGDTLVIDQHYVQGVNSGFTLDEIANAVASYRIPPIVAQDGTHSRLAWYLYRGVAAVFSIDSIAGNVLTLSGDRFDATAYYVGRVMQFHLGGTNQYTFARVVAQSGADLTLDQVPANLDDTWHGYILPETGGALPGEVAAVPGDVWDEAIAGHLTAGSTGAALNAAGAAGDPWTVDLPGSYEAPQAGYIIGRLAAIDTSAVSVTAASIAGHLTITAARTFEATISGLDIPADWVTALWTLKWSLDQPDTASLVQLRVSNPADGDDGLQRLLGAAVAVPMTAADGGLTIDQAGGTAAIWLSDELTALLSEATGLGWDIKFIDDDDDSTGVRGTADVALTETRTLA